VLFRSLAAETDAQASGIKIEYFDPANPALRSVYELVKKRRTLERIQEAFSPFRLPTELTIRTGSCEGVANAWYDRPAISVCYEYLDQIYRSLPKGTTADGVTAEDAVVGETFYVFAHEMGHAVFDLFQVPMLGDAENAADHFAGYMMLQFGRDQARALITGAAYTYNGYMQNPQVMAPLKAFSDIHGAPEQRYYNLLCLAYGADPTLFADLVSKGYLPNNRAINCKREYDQVAHRSPMGFASSWLRTWSTGWSNRRWTRRGSPRSRHRTCLRITLSPRALDRIAGLAGSSASISCPPMRWGADAAITERAIGRSAATPSRHGAPAARTQPCAVPSSPSRGLREVGILLSTSMSTTTGTWSLRPPALSRSATALRRLMRQPGRCQKTLLLKSPATMLGRSARKARYLPSALRSGPSWCLRLTPPLAFCAQTASKLQAIGPVMWTGAT